MRHKHLLLSMASAAEEAQRALGAELHLRETAQTHHAALLALKKQTKLMKDEKDKAEAELNALRLKYHEQEAGTALLQDKMRLYAGEDGVDMDELERALTIVKRRTEPGARVSRHCALAVLGNAMTSRMDAAPARSITSRSRPNAIPPWGGAPN